jgi:hypothetical protein
MKRATLGVLGWAIGAMCVALMVSLAFPPDVGAQITTGVESWAVPLLGLAGSIRYAVKAERIQQLRRQATPQASGDLEAVPWTLHDTQTYVSGTTTRLVFYSTAPASPNVGNMDAAGQLTAPNWFSIACFGFDILNDVSTAASQVGALDDVAKLMLVGQPVWTLTISGKKYGPFRLSSIHGTGFAQGGLASAIATPGSIQVGANGPAGDGGWYWDHAVIIPPNVGFNIEVVWAAAQTLDFGNTPLTFHMFGTMLRRVL